MRATIRLKKYEQAPKEWNEYSPYQERGDADIRGGIGSNPGGKRLTLDQLARRIDAGILGE